MPVFFTSSSAAYPWVNGYRQCGLYMGQNILHPQKGSGFSLNINKTEHTVQGDIGHKKGQVLDNCQKPRVSRQKFKHGCQEVNRSNS